MERSWYTLRVEGVNTFFDWQFGIAEQSLLRVEHGVGFGDSFATYWPPSNLDCPHCLIMIAESNPVADVAVILLIVLLLASFLTSFNAFQGNTTSNVPMCVASSGWSCRSW